MARSARTTRNARKAVSRGSRSAAGRRSAGRSIGRRAAGRKAIGRRSAGTAGRRAAATRRAPGRSAAGRKPAGRRSVAGRTRRTTATRTSRITRAKPAARTISRKSSTTMRRVTGPSAPMTMAEPRPSFEKPSFFEQAPEQMMPGIGEMAPEFELPDQDGSPVRLSDFRGQKVVVYFYPKDDAPGCVIEAQGFRDDYDTLQEKGIVVLGISKDDTESHRAFADKYGLNFRLLSDTTGETIQNYGCWVEKELYGVRRMGVQRATFLVDEEGRIMRTWPRVTPEGHSKEILMSV